VYIVLISDDGRKGETCSKFIAYCLSIQIIVLTEPNNNNNNKSRLIFFVLNFEPKLRVLFSVLYFSWYFLMFVNHKFTQKLCYIIE
jgi:hypothetical protein